MCTIRSKEIKSIQLSVQDTTDMAECCRLFYILCEVKAVEIVRQGTARQGRA
jgi:hypothetical protein